METERERVRTAIRRDKAEDYILTSLVGCAATVIITRVFLHLTGYPQIGNSVLHIAHALWGGLFLVIAIYLPLAYANRWALQTSALLSGIGIGLFIDEVGIGAGVVDRLRQLRYDVIGVNGQRTATDETKYSNKRTEMWCLMKDWLDAGGSIPEDRELKEHLCGPEFGYDGKGRRQLEHKEDLKERLGESPDAGDALAMSFAEPIYMKNAGANRKHTFSNHEYDCLNYG